MPPSLRRLCYFSRSRIPGSRAARAAEVERLVAVSRIVNRRFGITGMLLTSEDCFAQIIEGRPEAVGEVYARIERDWRHDGVTLLQDHAASGRRFPGWSMAAVIDLAWRHPGGGCPGQLYETLAGIVPQGPTN